MIRLKRHILERSMKLRRPVVLLAFGFMATTLMLFYMMYTPRRPPYSCLYSTIPLVFEMSNTYNNYDKENRIYFSLIGRLGNNLMQIASMYGLHKDTRTKMYFVNKSYQGIRILKLFSNLKKVMNFVPCMPPNLAEVKDMMPNKFAPSLANDILQTEEDVNVAGYLGSYKYWWPKYESDLRNIFTIDDHYSRVAHQYLQKLTSPLITRYAEKFGEQFKQLEMEKWGSFVTFVGVQIRRGDKVYLQDGWHLPNETYFKKAMDYFRNKYENVIFVVASESKYWAKNHLNGSDVIISTSSDDLLELALLAECDHMIISSGTYSWWAAWLANGETVYYQNHTIKGSAIESYFEDKDFFLPHWIPMGD